MLKEFICLVVDNGRQFLMDVLALDETDAFNKVQSQGYDCYCVSEDSNEFEFY